MELSYSSTKEVKKSIALETEEVLCNKLYKKIVEKINYIISSLQNEEMDKEIKDLYIHVFQRIYTKILKLDEETEQIEIPCMDLTIEECKIICNYLKASDIKACKFISPKYFGILIDIL